VSDLNLSQRGSSECDAKKGACAEVMCVLTIVHVGLSLSELHLVHALTGVPVEESLSAEHQSELLRHALEHLLDTSSSTRADT
jgi:hypothetical protein